MNRMSPRGRKNSDGATTTTTGNPVQRKAAKLVLEAKLEAIRDKTKALFKNYSSVGEEFSKTITETITGIDGLLLVAHGLADDWKPTRTKKPGKRIILVDDYVKTREKQLASFRAKGLGAGPFKVLAVYEDKSFKIATDEGAMIVTTRDVEKITTPPPVAVKVEAEQTNG
jgi:hypothetical protein